MSDEQQYKTAFDHVRPGADFEKRTLALLDQQRRKKEIHFMNRKKITAICGGIAACLLLAVGIFSMNRGGIAPGQSTQPPAVAAKGIVNIDGIIDEVAPGGQSFRIGDLWVAVDADTLYGIPGPNALPMEEQLVSDEFEVGNAVSGYTEDDISSGNVYAVRIYNNFPPEPAE